MVQESVFEDLVNTLIACRWVPGTTTRPILDPYEPAAGKQIVTTTKAEVLKIVGDYPLTLIDYFPESTGEAAVAGDPESGHTALNTLAIDDGQPGEPILVELGSSMAEVPYRFNFAFWAASTGVAQALMNDLRDRYRGFLVASDSIALYDYNTDPEIPVCPMGVDGFSYVRSAEDETAAHEATMFYAQLTLTDQVDDPRGFN